MPTTAQKGKFDAADENESYGFVVTADRDGTQERAFCRASVRVGATAQMSASLSA